MKTKRFVLMCSVICLAILFIIGFFSGLQTPQAQAASLGDVSYAQDHIIVKLKQDPAKDFSAESTGYDTLDILMNQFEVQSVDLLYESTLGNQALKKEIGLTRTYVVSLGDSFSVAEAVSAFSRDPQVEYAEPDYIGYLTLTPNDTYYASDQWALNNTGQLGGTSGADIDAPEAWNITTGSSGVVIAVIDTGLDLVHPDFPTDKVVAGWDFVNDDNDPQDDNWHGTHVSGIVAAKTNNNKGMAGVCWECKIMPLKALNSSGSGWSTDMALAINYAVDNDADVINMSVVVPVDVPFLHDAVIYAYNNQVPIVAAMGNEGDSTVNYPAAYIETIAVGSTDNNDARSSFSCYGSHIDLAAPGTEIFSTIYDITYNYGWASGTSMAAPHVSGVLGLIESLKPDYTVEQLRTILRSTADDKGTPGWDQYYGAGRLNAYQAVKSLIPGSIKLTASKYGMQDMPYKASALVSPSTAEQPLTFRWEAEGQTTMTHTVDLDDWITYTWSITGTYWITVNVWNDYGTATAARQVTIIAPVPNAEIVNLPLLLRP